MRGKLPTPFWSSETLFSLKEMYEMSISPRGVIKCLRKRGKHQSRCSTYNNLHLCNKINFTQSGFAKVKAYNGDVDFNYHSVCKWKLSKKKDYAIHCFAEDKDLEGKVWKNLELTTKRIKDSSLIIAPDFSMYIDQFLQTFNLYQVWKSRLVTAFWQSCGLPVVPLVSWGNVDSLKYSLEGLPSHSIIALSATCCHRCKGAWNLWTYAVKTVVKELRPTKLIIYGDPELKVPVDVPVKIITDYVHKKLRKL